MAGCQAYQWGAHYPDMVDAILPFCASARTSSHNKVFLEGVKAALTADSAFEGGDYDSPPEAGLRAFARVYAGWAFSQAFYCERLHRELGFETWEELLLDWERDHLDWDANDLLAKLRTWQSGDISTGVLYRGDFERALAAIRARAILVPCTTDLYFPPEDNALEAAHMPNAVLRPYASPWGHCVASPEPPRQRLHPVPGRVRVRAAGRRASTSHIVNREKLGPRGSIDDRRCLSFPGCCQPGADLAPTARVVGIRASVTPVLVMTAASCRADGSPRQGARGSGR